MSDWRDRMVGDRMAVDSTFSDRVANSRFSSQEWGLIMTATSFEIENADDADEARLVADTSDLPQMLPQLDKVARTGPMGAVGESPGAEGRGGGFLDSVLGFLGLDDGDGSDDEKLEAAERLVSDYARELQRHLEENGKWEGIRTAAADTADEDSHDSGR